jgi:hypothetical protein
MAPSAADERRSNRTLKRLETERRRLEEDPGDTDVDSPEEPERRDERDLPDDALREARDRVGDD